MTHKSIHYVLVIFLCFFGIVHDSSALELEIEKETSGLVLLNYSYFDMIVPGKYGLSLGFSPGPDQSWEAEYMKSDVSVPIFIADIGSIKDERLSLIRRVYFWGAGFNVSYGLSYLRFSAHLGDALLRRLSLGSYPSVDLIDIQSIGFNVAVGNRWFFERGFVVGIDWVSLAQPFYTFRREANFLTYVTDEGDREKVDTAVKVASYLPRVALLKIQIGLSF